MAQYPQGIFQSLQYLLKKVRILSLQKQSVYPSIIVSPSSYTLPGKGFYQINGGTIIFPNPATMQGQTITITGVLNDVTISSTPPVYQGGTPVTLLATNGLISATAANGFWYVTSVI